MKELSDHLTLLLIALSFWGALYAWVSADMADPDSFFAGSAWAPWGLAAAVAVSLVAWFQRLRARPDRRRVGAGACLRLWLYVLVASCALYLFFGQPYHKGSVVIWLGLAAGVFALSASLTLAFEGAPKGLRRLDLVLFNIAILLVTAELGLRAMAGVSPNVLFQRQDASVVSNIERTRLAPGTMKFGFPVNSQGHYDSEFGSVGERRRVLSISDSFSSGPVPHHYHFTTVAERALPGVEIFNLGMSAIGLPEYLHLLAYEGLVLDPELVVVNLFVGNDLRYRRIKKEAHLLGEIFDSGNVLAYQVPRRLAILAEERSALGAEAVAASKDRYGKGCIDSVQRLHKVFPWLLDPGLEKAHMSAQKYFEIELRRATTLSTQSQEEYLLELQPLLQMRELLEETPLLVMIMPDVFQVEDPLWNRLQKASKVPLKRNIGQEILRPWLEQHEIPYLDLLPLFRAAEPLADGQRHLYNRNDTHVNRRGSELTGKALASFVEQHLP